MQTQFMPSSAHLFLLCMHHNMAILAAILYLLFLPPFLCMNSSASASMLRSNETDHETLLLFKNQLQGNPLVSWNNSIHFCQWQGVACDSRNLRVIALELPGQALMGSLSPNIANLTFLNTLDLSKNNFTGPVPKEIGRLSNLIVLDLGRNSFDGELPINVTKCPRLQELILGHNRFVGRIPEEFGSLRELTLLVLSYNSLTGNIPPTFGNLTSLVQFSLLSCSLEGSIPDVLGSVRSLKFFQVGLNNLSGTIPASIYNLSALTYFAIAANQLNGTLSPDLGLSFPKLNNLYVGGNLFTGSIPVSLANASQLQEADFSLNSFSEFMPVSFTKLQVLRLLNLASNLLGGKTNGDDLNFLFSLTNLTSLQVLGLDGNGLNGTIPHSVSNLSANLQELWLGENNIYGSIPPEIANLQSLTRLGMEKNLITGPIPSEIGKLTVLAELMLNGNGITGTIPSSVGNMTQLARLNLARNDLEGPIPPTLANCQHMQEIYFFHNGFSGNLPKELFSLSSLSVLLDLSSNSLTGTLPSEVGNLINLRMLLIRDNNLSGEIPATLGKCIYLEVLYLDGNSFQGKIPESLISLRGIQEIDLSLNRLTGKIPQFLGELPNLVSLNLSFNDLEGQVPYKGLFANVSEFSIIGNRRLCGGVKALNLTACAISILEKKYERSPTIKIIIPTSVGCLLLILVSIAFIVTCRKRKSKQTLPSTSPMVDPFISVSYTELLKAAEDFSQANLIGVGSYGTVYKGILNHDHQERIVAIKVLNLLQKGGSRSFMAECQALRNIRHRNLVKIITACSGTDYRGNDFKALVFEYMSNGSLEEWLHPNESEHNDLRSLSFLQRLKIALDVASALNYLHQDCPTPIAHRDLKPSNILLDEDMKAHVSDFGLSRLLLQSETGMSSYVSTSSSLIKGSIGYVAPEYGMGVKPSVHGDVYSYGIILLEMFTGKRPTDEIFNDGLILHSFVKQALQEEVLMRILDPKLLQGVKLLKEGSNQNKITYKMEDSLHHVLGVGLQCSLDSPTERMDMKSVVQALQSIMDGCINSGK